MRFMAHGSMRGTIKRALARILKYLVLIIFSLVTIYPLYWLFITSLKDNSELYAGPFSLPLNFRIQNYVEAWETANIGVSFFNSLCISAISVAVILLFASMAAYVLAKIRPHPALYIYFTLGIMIPVHAVLIPTFIIIRNLGLMNKHLGLILIYVSGELPLAIFILYGFMKSLSKEIGEAALIDGCSQVKSFFLIILPLSKAGLFTVGTLSFLNCWKEYLFAYLTISTTKLKTLTQSIMSLRGQYVTNYGLLCAGIMIAIIPAIIIYILFQEQIIKGMTAGALKG